VKSRLLSAANVVGMGEEKKCRQNFGGGNLLENVLGILMMR
jgi:hypothetical protein